ncbi:MAG: hypothetical protein ACFFCT_01195 [Candidatus Odinarchaeota archaeon]
MGRRLTLGPKPEVDPLEESSYSSFSVTSSTEIRWDDRKQRRALAFPLFLSLMSIILGLTYAILTVIVASVILILVMMPGTGVSRAELQKNPWSQAHRTDTSWITSDKIEGLDCKTPTGTRQMIGLDLGNAKSILLGDISSFVRAVDGSAGFGFTVTMKPEKIQRAMDEERVSDMIEEYLNTIPKGEVEAYILRRGGLWLAHVNAIGHAKESVDIESFDSAVKASIPMEKWKRIKSKTLVSRVTQLAVDNQSDWFYAAGTELAEWLVQLRSELASEVGSNIPGQFLAPIRGRPGDYRLGVTINPDTLQTGPPVGFSHSELESGTLLCGGTSESRMRVIALLTTELLHAGKRVIVFTSNKMSLGYTRLSEGAVHLEVGKDLVLNPVDSEGIPRSDYVPLLISSLEPVAGADLRGAADLELAITRAVTLGNATLADVQLGSAFDEVIASAPDSPKLPDSAPSNKSKAGMDAVRSLHQGSAAKAFYGTQTIPTARLTESALTVVRVRLGSTSLDHFAWNVICVKLAGLRPDPNLVVVLDGAENMRVRNRRFMKHDSFSERLLENLKKRGPVVLSLEHPVDMAPGAIGTLASCISLRLREAVDIKIASDLLGLNVITTGMHTKARISPRESSFLNIMNDDTALLVHDGTETCQPIQLDPAPDLNPESATEEDSNQLSTLLSSEDSEATRSEGSLLDRVSAGSTALAIRILKLLERYEPLTQEAVRRFIVSSSSDNDPDVETVLARLEHASMILRGHEVHSGVSYTNFRITMKGSMALRQTEGMESAIV